MQRFNITPSTVNSIKYFGFDELYISPDLSFISGVTDYTTGLVDGDKVLVKSSIKHDNGFVVPDDNILPITVNDVERQGKVAVIVMIPIKELKKTLRLPLYYENGRRFVYENNEPKTISDSEITDILQNKGYVNNDGGPSYDILNEYPKLVTQKYIEYNGNISYFFKKKDCRSGFIINGRFYEHDGEGEYLEIDSWLYIEDGKLVVGELEYDVNINYQVDTNKIIPPSIKYSKYNKAIGKGEIIGVIDDNIIKVSDRDEFIYDYLPRQWNRVQKFTINIIENPFIVMESVMAGGYIHFVDIDGKRYNLSFEKMEVADDVFYVTDIDGVKYEMSDNFMNNDEKYLFYKYQDEYLSDEFIIYPYGEDSDEDGIPVNSALRMKSNGGNFLILIPINDKLPYIEGNTIIARAIKPFVRKCFVQYDETLQPFIIHGGIRYDIEDRLYDSIDIADKKLRLSYIDSSETASVTMPTLEKVGYAIETEGEEPNITYIAKSKNKIYYLDNDVIKFGLNNSGHTVLNSSGVTIDGEVYKVQYEAIEKGDFCNENNEVDELLYVEILDEPEYELDILSVEGSSTYLCRPKVDDDSLSIIDKELIIRDIVDEITENSDSFVFIPKNKTFGINKMKPEVGMMDAMHTDFPISISDRQDVYDSLKIGKITSHITFTLPLETKISNNLFAEDIVHNHFIDYMSENAINDIVDMEKDVYYPVRYLNEPSDTCGSNNEYIQITEVRFNMHFRTRNLENWKVYDELTTNDIDLCNWFITDYKYYSDNCDTNSLQSSSDLIGLMNFTTNEVRNQAKKIGRSFLRVSYYSTNDPETQVLLGTSVIYLNENTLLKKHLTLNTMGMILFGEVDEYQVDKEEQIYWSTTECEANTEVIGNKYLNDSLRLSSRLVVTDKYNTDTSSEGFYIYMFKEYSKLGHINTIYAKFEFNHAGIGQTIPMVIPRKDSRLMKISNDADLKELKKGFSMADIYEQIYFPIRVKYDTNTNRYVYWLDGNLIYNTNEKNVMEFNLFEIKFKDESFDESNN